MQLCRKYGIGLCSVVVCCLATAGIFLEGCSASSNVEGGCFSTEQEGQRSLPVAETYVMNVNSSQGSRIDVYTRVPYSKLEFEEGEDDFIASYTLSYIFWDETGAVVQTRDIDQTVKVGSYKESTSQRGDFALQTFIMPPGNYSFELIVVDDASKLTYRKRQKIVARDFSQGSFSASSFLLLEGAVKGSGNQISLHPLFPQGVSLLRDSLGIFQEVYRVLPNDSLLLSFSYSEPIPRADLEKAFFNTYPPDRFGYYANESAGDSIYYQKDSMFVAGRRGTVQLLQFFPKPKPGMTTMTRSVILIHDNQRDTVTSMEKIPVHGPTFPRVTSRQDLILAAGLIAYDREMDSLRAAPPGMQEEALEKFWKQHGGISRRNEFEHRLEEANQFFSTTTDGWKTPMGITYVVCGPPDNVECAGRLTETWYYNIGDRAFAIPFRQMSEDADMPYFEMVPNSINESLWAYFVDNWRRQ
jgi:GWxTD domain-containing protein